MSPSTAQNDPANPLVLLEPNSLYVSTNQLIAQIGKFHWVLYITDEKGIATKHHWAVLPANSSTIEGPVSEIVHPVTTYSKTEGIAAFAFFRIEGFTPTPDMDDVLHKIFHNVFDPPYPLGYTTVPENRKNGISCRTWAMCVCKELMKAGHIVRADSDNDVNKIEKFVTDKSVEIELLSSVEGAFNSSVVLAV